MRSPFLLTATVHPSPRAIGKVRNPEQRVEQYQKALRWLGWFRSEFSTLLFCENSGTKLNEFLPLQNWYKERGKRLELWNVPMPASSEFMGKGWGEGLIIQWALDHIPALVSGNSFIKITGRYQVINLIPILGIIRRSLRMYPDLKLICQSFSQQDRNHTRTEFFWSNIPFYRENLIDIYSGVDDSSGYFIEHAIGDRISKLSGRFQIGILPVPVILRGLMGWNAQPVTSMKEIFRQMIKQTLFPQKTVKLL